MEAKKKFLKRRKGKGEGDCRYKSEELELLRDNIDPRIKYPSYKAKSSGR